MIDISSNSAEYDDNHYEALMTRQCKADKKYDTLQEYNYIPTGSTVAFQWEDGQSLTCGMIIDKEDYNNKD